MCIYRRVVDGLWLERQIDFWAGVNALRVTEVLQAPGYLLLFWMARRLMLLLQCPMPSAELLLESLVRLPGELHGRHSISCPMNDRARPGFQTEG